MARTNPPNHSNRSNNSGSNRGDYDDREDINRKNVGGEHPKSLKKILSDAANFIIYDKNDAYIDGDYLYDDIALDFEIDESDVEFTKIPLKSERVGAKANSSLNLKGTNQNGENKKCSININQERFKKHRNIRFTAIKTLRRKKYIKSALTIEKKENGNISATQTFDSVKISENPNSKHSKNNKGRKSSGYGYGYASMPSQESDAEFNKVSASVSVTDDSAFSNIRHNISKISETPEQIRRRRKIKNKANILNTCKRIAIALFSVVAGAVTMPFGMNPMGVSLICAADKYIFYIYSGLIISIAFSEESSFGLFIIYTAVAAVKYYLKYNRSREKSRMLATSQSYRNLPTGEKSRLMSLVHFNDTGSITISILLNAVTSCVAGIIKIAFKMPDVIYSDIIVVILFVLISMLFTYLYCGLFEIGKDNKLLEKAGTCSVIFTLAYALAPLYIYSLSFGYIFSFVVTLIAAGSGVRKKYAETESMFEDERNQENENENNSDEKIINRFNLNTLSQDGTLSDMTRGALIGLLCGIALGDTAGAVTLGVCGLISGLFFAQSVTLAVTAGLISAISYSVYVAGMGAIQTYIPNMIIGLTFYMPISAAYSKAAKADKNDKQGAKRSPVLDKGLLMTELPAIKLNNLSDAFQNLSSTFYELSERLKNPSFMEIKAMAASSVETICEICGNKEFCSLTNKNNFSAVQRRCAEYILKKNRLDRDGFTQAYREHCICLDAIEMKINSLYLGRVDENIKNDKTKVFASHYENIAKLLSNNSKSGKEDIAFESGLSERIFIQLQNMGIDSENVIVIGERKKTVYIFGIKMVDYSGTIEDITEMIEEMCGVYLSEPEYILKENYVIMKIQSRNKFKIQSLQMSKAADSGYSEDDEPISNGSSTASKKQKKEINGDSTVVFDNDDGYFYSVVSDGMGSGKNAALSSRLTVLLMEKLLAAGNQKDLTLEMLNSMLIAKNDECFASVDLFEADLLTGKASFIKAGAAPSFVIRANRLFKIQSSTVPAGIIANMNSEQTKFELEAGDYVLMLSDGIISTFEEGTWLIEMLSSEKNLQEPQTLLSRILKQARERNARKDDMSVLFMKVAEDRR